MEPGKGVKKTQPVVFRVACNECHAKKIRCLPSLGACRRCVSHGIDCTYSPRRSMGRPFKKIGRSTPDSSKKLGARELTSTVGAANLSVSQPWDQQFSSRASEDGSTVRVPAPATEVSHSSSDMEYNLRDQSNLSPHPACARFES